MGAFIRLILTKAPSMISQGRHRALQGWLRSLPESALESTPWLLYWLGVCRMPFDLNEGREHFEKAFALLKNADDGAGVLLAWAGVVYATNLELGDLRKLDPWIAMIGDVLARYRNPPPPVGAQVRRTASWRSASAGGPPRVRGMEEERIALVERRGSSLRSRRLLLLSHSVWVGGKATAEGARLIRASPGGAGGRRLRSRRIMGRMAETWAAWLMGTPGSA
jgi:hypothetical protein